MPDGVFDSGNPSSAPGLFDQLVGEGKKFQDPEALAKSKIESDRFIERLQEENRQMREELGGRDSVEEQLRKFQESQRNTPSTPPASGAEANQPAKPATVDHNDLAKLVRETLSQEEQNRTAARNVNEVAERLTQVYGSPEKANEVVRTKAAELGVSIEFLQDVASRSPKAFFAQFGLENASKPTAPSAPRGDVNPAALGNQHSGGPKPGTYAFYENMRRTNPSQYFNPKIQNQMHQEALEKGDAFFE